MGSNPIARSKTPIALLLIAFALLVGVFIADGFKVYRKTNDRTASGRKYNDFGMFHEGARRVLAHEDPLTVEGWGFPYLPPFYALMAPLGLMSAGKAVVTWHIVKALALLGAAWAVYKLLVRAGFRHPEVGFLIGVFGILRALDSDLQLGQVNVFVSAAVFLTIYAYLTHRDEIAGLAGAFAALYKVNPGLVLVFFLWKQRYRVLAWAAIGLVLVGALLPFAVMGVDETMRIYGGFYQRLIAPTLAEGMRDESGYAPGQSVPAAFTRWLDGMDRTTVHALGLAAQAGLLALLLLLTRRTGDDNRRSPRVLLETGLVVMLMLLAAPYARKAQFVSMLLPLAACASYAIESRSRAIGVFTGIAALAPMIMAPDAIGKLLGRAAAERAAFYGDFTIAGLSLLLATALALRQERRSEAARAAGVEGPDLELSVFFPAYNEGLNIGAVVERALEVLPGVARRYEVIVVDDCSKDDTPKVLRALEEKHPGIVRPIRQPQNRGYGGAVKTGLASAKYRHVFFSDGDGQFDLHELPAFLEPLRAGRCDAVIGYRRKRRDPFLRLVNAYCWGALVRTLFGIPARDIDCAYKVLPTAIVHRLDLKAEGALISTEILAKLDRAGCRILERPVTHLPRERGAATGANIRVILRAFRELFRFRKELARFQLSDVSLPQQEGAACPASTR